MRKVRLIRATDGVLAVDDEIWYRNVIYNNPHDFLTKSQCTIDDYLVLNYKSIIYDTVSEAILHDSPYIRAVVARLGTEAERRQLVDDVPIVQNVLAIYCDNDTHLLMFKHATLSAVSIKRVAKYGDHRVHLAMVNSLMIDVLKYVARYGNRVIHELLWDSEHSVVRLEVAKAADTDILIKMLNTKINRHKEAVLSAVKHNLKLRGVTV